MEAASWLLRDILKLGTQKYLLSKSRIICFQQVIGLAIPA
jgi:hypothetical protein